MKRRTALTLLVSAVAVSVMGSMSTCQSFPTLNPDRASRKDVTRFLAHSGVNLPWMTYGCDLGLDPYYDVPSGFAAKREALAGHFAFLSEHSVRLCRVFLFCDLRSGLRRGDGGEILGFDEFVYQDMNALLETAKESGIRILPVLFDYTIADGNRHEVTGSVGEHPEFITDESRRRELLENAVRPFLTQFGRREEIYAWDVMNEPKFARHVKAREVHEFIRECIALIKEEAPGALVTVGDYNGQGLDDAYYADCDLIQVHCYTRFPKSLGRRARIRDPHRPIVIGETEPDNLTMKLDEAFGMGFDGILFWSLLADDGYDFRRVAWQYRDWALLHDS